MQEWPESQAAALAVVARGDQIFQLSPSDFEVKSQSRPNWLHWVSCIRNRWSCTCEFYRNSGGRACVHLLAVRLRSRLVQAQGPLDVELACQRCGSSDVVRAGRRLNKSGPVRRFECRSCGAHLSGKEGFHKRRADPDAIAKALDLYFRGTSFRQVAAHFSQAYSLPISAMTVYRWVVHYSRLAAEWMDRQAARVGDKWHVDERVVNVNGEKAFLWNVMDAETRFLLASRISKGRSLDDARLAFKDAKAATAVRPTELRSDGWPGYPLAIKREFGRRRRKSDAPRDPKRGFSRSDWTPHKPVPSIRARDSNNILERLNGTSKDRTKVMRAYDNLRGAGALSLGWQVHYNMVRDHLSLGTTPGTVARLPELGEFRWRTLLELAVKGERAAESKAGTH